MRGSAPDTCLLLTATVRPSPGMTGSRHNDPTRRLAEYRTAIAHAAAVADRVGARVVVGENSGSAPELAADSGGVEVVDVPPLAPADVAGGKGWAEMRLVAVAHERCSTLRAARVVWKLTGRYRVLNLAPLVRRWPGADLTVNLRRHPEPWADMWVWAATQRGLVALDAHADRLRDDVEPYREAERSMFDLVVDLAAGPDLRVVPRLPVEPRLSGIRGWDGRRYDDPRQRAKWALRSVARRVAPGWWV